MGDPERTTTYQTSEVVERREGIFNLDEIGLSPLDHGGLYGDGCFEGILIAHGRVWLFKEHLERWYRSAEMTSIDFPYSIEDIAWRTLETIRKVGIGSDEQGYLRPVLTRGLGNLGINPAKCIAPTIYVIASTIALYPPEKYETGIELSVARKTRRPDPEVVDPNIKSLNYLNNIFSLLETREEGRLETLMLTHKGYVAEASADNIFTIHRRKGWENDPSKVDIRTPLGDYCLRGITRNTIIDLARNEGYQVQEDPHLLPLDFAGPDKECFMTGTGAGLMPVTAVESNSVGDGRPGPVTKHLLEKLRANQRSPESGLPVDASFEDVKRYLLK